MNLDMPINHRKQWTNKEFNQLLKETNNKLNIKKIAQNHKRTIEAIKFRLIRYAVKLIDEEPNTSLKHICELTNLSREDLLEGFKKINYNYKEIEEEVEDIYLNHINNLNYKSFSSFIKVSNLKISTLLRSLLFSTIDLTCSVIDSML
jgi:repressor of nif and glnA expression